MKKILLYSLFFFLFNNSLMAQVDYINYQSSNANSMMFNSLRDAQARHDKAVEYAKSLLKWTNDLNAQETDLIFQNAIKVYQQKLKYLLTGKDVQISQEANNLILIESGIGEEISKYNQRVAEAKRKTDEDNSPKRIYERGLSKLKNEDYSGALIDFKKVTEIAPDFAAGYFNVGLCYFMQKKYESASQYLDKSILIDPKPYAYNYKGWAEYYKKNYVQAIQDFTLQIENSNPDDPSGYYNRGSAKSELGDFFGAISDYQKAIEIKPDFSMAYNNLGWVYFEKKDYQKALKYANKSIEVDSENSVAYDSRAEIKFNSNDYKGAILDCNKALELDSKLGNSYLIRGRAYYRLGKKEEACNDWSSAGQYGKTEAYDFISKYCK
ncbi:MAG: tetratricopeptide repeat protein [Bacteroidales bacterium]